MKRVVLLLCLSCLCIPAFAELPAFYKNVDRIVWVVKEAAPVVQGWKALGFPTMDVGEIGLGESQFRGKPCEGRIRVALASLAGAQVVWIQPVSGNNAYAEFLQQRGSGIFSLVHNVSTPEALSLEIKRLQAAGAAILQQGTYERDGESVSYAYMDTLREGKYSLGLIADPSSDRFDAPVQGEVAATALKMSQYALVVRDMRPVSAFWKKLGLPEFSYTHPSLSNLRYHGKPGQFDQELGWQRHGNVVYEWITPLKGPTVYGDFLKSHGDGVHHLAFQVDDMEKAIASWTKAGFQIVQSGAWGEEGKPGAGKFAYVDTSSLGGVTIELLWDFK